jgi:hypothetical protein
MFPATWFRKQSGTLPNCDQCNVAAGDASGNVLEKGREVTGAVAQQCTNQTCENVLRENGLCENGLCENGQYEEEEEEELEDDEPEDGHGEELEEEPEEDGPKEENDTGDQKDDGTHDVEAEEVEEEEETEEEHGHRESCAESGSDYSSESGSESESQSESESDHPTKPEEKVRSVTADELSSNMVAVAAADFKTDPHDECFCSDCACSRESSDADEPKRDRSASPVHKTRTRTSEQDNIYFDYSTIDIVGIERDVSQEIVEVIRNRYQRWCEETQTFTLPIGVLCQGLEAELPATFIITFENWYEQVYSKPYCSSHPQDLFPGDDLSFFCSTDEEFQPDKMVWKDEPCVPSSTWRSMIGFVLPAPAAKTKDVTDLLRPFSWDLFRCGSPFRPHAWHWLKTMVPDYVNPILVLSKGKNQEYVEAFFSLQPLATSDRYLRRDGTIPS